MERGYAYTDDGVARDWDCDFLACGILDAEHGILRTLLGDVRDGREPAEGLVQHTAGWREYS